MPVIRDLPLTLGFDEMLRRQGLADRKRVSPRLMDRLRELIESVHHQHLLEPAIAYESYPILEAQHDRLYLKGGMVFHSRLLAKALIAAKELAVAVCTIGPHLEKKVTDDFAQNEVFRATLLDGIGSAAVDHLSREACHLIRQEAGSRDYDASSPFSPGMQGLPISDQWVICSSAQAEQIGVHLTSSAMLVPRKSASMVIGLGERLPTWTQVEACQICNLKAICRHRIQSRR